MWRLVLLVLALAGVAGCASDGSFAEAWKDLRGDNMQMRSDSARAFREFDQQSRLKP